MTNSWLLDCFCFIMRFKYGDNPWRVTPDILGREYAPLLLIESCLGERALPLSFHGFISPSPEFKGCHFRDSTGMIWVLYDSTDEASEQLITKFHEIGELVDLRLAEFWPKYRVVSEIYSMFAGDQRYDVFAHSLATSVISLIEQAITFILELMTGDWNSLEQLLRPYAKAMAVTVGESKEWATIVAALILVIIAALVKLFLRLIQHSIESLMKALAAILEFALTFLTRLFYLDKETNLTNLGGVQCA